MPPDMLIDADRGDPVEPRRVVDETTLALGEDRSVRGMPGHPKACGRPGDGEVVDHDRLQRPPEPATGDLRPRGGGLRGVLPPRAPAVITPIAADPDQQGRGPVPERLVRKSAGDRVSHDAFGAALATPRVRLDDATLDHRPIRFETLPDGLKTELVESAERGETGRGEGSVEHVEVFQMGSVGTSILEDLDPYPRTSTPIPTTPSTAKSHFGVTTKASATRPSLRCIAYSCGSLDHDHVANHAGPLKVWLTSGFMPPV